MDVRLPDGTIVQNVPEGITQADLMSRVQASRSRQPAPTPAFEQEAAQTVNEPPSWYQPMRQVGLTGRHGLEAFGGGVIANKLGLPQPQNALERVVGDITGTMVGAGGIAGIAGKVAPMAQGIPKALAKLLSSNPGALTASAAGAGTGGGLAREGGAGPWGQMAASLAGGVVPAVPGMAASLGQSIRNAVYPSVGNIATKAAGSQAPAVIDALQSTKSAVPGVNLTAGQASVPANSAEIAALQRLVSEGKAPSTYFGPAGVEGQQQLARRQAVQQIGGTPEKLAQAIASRKTTSDVNYEVAFNEVVKRDKGLRELWKNPYFHDEVGEAWKLMRAKGLPLKGNLTEFLHFVKEGLDARLQTLTNPMQPAISKATKDAVLDAKAKLLTWLETKNPAYETARLEHALASKPINQMKVGQQLEQSLVAPATETERATAFANAVRQAENTVSKATGRPRIEDLTTQQRASLDAIESEFKRNAEYARLASKGAKNLPNRIGAPELPPTGFFQPFVSAARGWVNKALGTGLEKGLERTAASMTDPKALAKAMLAEQAKRGVSSDAARRAALAAALYGTQQGQ